MKTEEIVERARERLGISELNAMQIAMERTEARDIILLSPTGSGKTLAFALRLLRNVDAHVDGIKAVVLAPSRELVIQLASVIRSLSGLKVVELYGGHAMTDEVNSLSVVPDIIVATPGRLLDHLHRRTIDIAAVRSVVLDEYDKMLQLGFLDEMGKIVGRMKRLNFRMLTSATILDELPPFMGDPSHYQVFDFAPDMPEPVSTTEIIRVDSPDPDKLATLEQLLRSLPYGKTIVFANHRESAERIHSYLRDRGLPAGLYHGALDQQDRRIALELLDNETTPILVATDLAARGLDLDSVANVIHYHLPLSPDAWTHRNGRTARQGADGKVFVIVSPKESLPDYIATDTVAHTLPPSFDPLVSRKATLYFNAGRREKISKSDIAGFLIQKGGLAPDEVGRITLDDHYALAAIPAAKLRDVIAAIAPHRLKNRRVRITPLSK